MSSTLRETILAHRSRRTEPITEASASPEALPVAPKPVAPPAGKKGRGGKISDPDFQRVGLLIRKEYFVKIQRHLVGTPDDLSDYLDRLLAKTIKQIGD